MNEQMFEAQYVLLDVKDEQPDKVLVLYMIDDDLTVSGNMTYIESLGVLELSKDQIKQMLIDEE